jgi:hypothetical protein
MIRVSAVFCLISATACAQGDALQKALPLRIDCSQGRCRPWPGSLEFKNSERMVVVTSEKKWTCTLGTPAEALPNSQDNTAGDASHTQSGVATGNPENGPSPHANPDMLPPQECQVAGGHPTHLIFRSPGLDPVQVSIRVAAVPRSPSTLLEVLEMSSLVLGLSCFVMGLAVFMKLRNHAEAAIHSDQRMISRLRGMGETAKSLDADLCFLPASPKISPRLQQTLPERYETAPPRPDSGLEDRFVRAVENWSKMFGPPPAAIQEGLESLKVVHGVLSAAELQRRQEELVRRCVLVSDRDMDKQHRDERQQAALREIIEAAGLKEIMPKRGDRFDPQRHRASGFRRPSFGQYRGGEVAGVVIRGLERDGNVIERAEVEQYD